MKKLIIGSISTLSLMLLSIGCAVDSKSIKHESAHKAHWGYEGEVAPAHWGELDPKFATCSIGKTQSPIDVVPTKDVDLQPLKINYQSGATDVIYNGHTVQVDVKPGSTLTVDGKVFELKQFHFHTPSENKIKGKSFPLEAHFVHQAKDGQLAVLALMFDEGEANKILAKIWSKFPLKEGEKVSLDLKADDIKALLPGNKDYYKFIGSLTTPPCSENVLWLVLKTPSHTSKEQVKAFFDIMGHHNNRPTQPTNGREIDE